MSAPTEELTKKPTGKITPTPWIKISGVFGAAATVLGLIWGTTQIHEKIRVTPLLERIAALEKGMLRPDPIENEGGKATASTNASRQADVLLSSHGHGNPQKGDSEQLSSRLSRELAEAQSRASSLERELRIVRQNTADLTNSLAAEKEKFTTADRDLKSAHQQISAISRTLERAGVNGDTPQRKLDILLADWRSLQTTLANSPLKAVKRGENGLIACVLGARRDNDILKVQVAFLSESVNVEPTIIYDWCKLHDERGRVYSGSNLTFSHGETRPGSYTVKLAPHDATLACIEFSAFPVTATKISKIELEGSVSLVLQDLTID